MNQITLFLCLFLTIHICSGQDLIVTGIFDGNLSGGSPKAIELFVINDIPDLSTYGFSNSSNGNGVSQVEFQFSGSATAGGYLYITRNAEDFSSFFGFDANFVTSSANNNGDDAIAIYNNVTEDSSGSLQGTQIDGYGDLDVDGTGEVWDYQDGWAYRINGTGPDGTTFTPAHWIISGINENDDDTTQADATNPWPIETYTTDPPECSFELGAITATCNSASTAVDGVTISIPFTGGGTTMYTVTITTGDGIIEGDDPTTTAEGVLMITSILEDTMITFEITSIACMISQDIITPPCLPPTEVGNIATLRSGVLGEPYKLTGEAILTFFQNFRNQKFIEDASGAILLDDTAGVITTTYDIGDGISEVTGTLQNLNGMLHLLPSVDPGQAFTTGNAVEALEVTVPELIANPNNYESEFVQIKNALIDTTTNIEWINDTAYTLTTPEGTYTFRTSFNNVDYIGTATPTVAQNISGIITEQENGNYVITARSLADFGEFLNVTEQEQPIFSVFPNPAKGLITIATAISGQKTVTIYDSSGRRVINTTTDKYVDISTLSQGMYFVRIKEGTHAHMISLIVQ